MLMPSNPLTQTARGIRLLLLLACAFACQAQSVIFINPGRSDEAYWRSASNAMLAAAHSLGMQLEIRPTERDHTRTLQIVNEIIALPPAQRPDYVILTNDYGLATAALPLLNAEKIKVFLAFNGILTASDWAIIGEPRDRFPYWIGSLEPLAEDIGYQTAKGLIELGRQKRAQAPDGKLHLLALAGDRSTASSILRTKGMRRAVEEATDVVLDQVVYAQWRQDSAREKATWLFARHPMARLIWAANDQMALGAMESLAQRGGRAGEDAWFCATNTSPEALHALRDGQLSVLFGGHFMAGAWSLVLLYDHYHGHDFSTDTSSLRKRMSTLLTPQDAERYLKHFGDDRFDIDFRRYSKALQPALKDYDFSFSQLLETQERVVSR